jgi:hypothetical protein
MVEIRTPADVKDGTLFVTEASNKVGNGAVIESTYVTPVLVCKNQGKTPAWILERSIRCQVWDGNTELPDSPNFNPGMPFETNKYIRPVSVGAEDSHIFTCKAAGRLKKPSDCIFIYGKVRYRDIFGKKRETVFGWKFYRTSDLLPIESDAFHRTT